MNLHEIVSIVIIQLSIIMNTCALIALKRSRTLSPSIRLFSMNFLVSNILFSTAATFSTLLGSDIYSEQMHDDCIVILFGASVMIQSYFVTSFTISAMALDRLVAIVFPFRYIELLRGSRMKKACASLWGLGFLTTLSYNFSNSHLILSCISGNYNSYYVSVSLFKNNITIIGIMNLLILIINVILFLSLFIYIAKKNYKKRLYGVSNFKKTIGNFCCLCSLIWSFLHCHCCYLFFPR